MKFVVLLEISAKGEKFPRKFNRTLFSSGELANQRAYIVLEDLNEQIWLWLGSGLSRVHRAVAQRSAGFARSHGHEVDQYIVGRGFNVIEIQEGEEPPPEFTTLLNQKLEVHGDYNLIVGAPEVAREPVKPLRVTDEEVIAEKAKPEAELILEENQVEEVVEEVVEPKDPTKNYIILPKLLELPPNEKHIYVDGLVQRALLGLEKEGMVSQGTQENSFILYSKDGDLLGTVLLDPVSRDEIVYKANWIREEDEKLFAKQLSKPSS
ncbi:MAG: hypothetical protein ACE5I5_02680 [Candidatus Heimdallarchaeota archaeon]